MSKVSKLICGLIGAIIFTTAMWLFNFMWKNNGAFWFLVLALSWKYFYGNLFTDYDNNDCEVEKNEI